MRAISPTVYVPAIDDPAGVTADDLATLLDQARQNELGKARLLIHRDPAAALHEMLIVHAAGHYIRPHRNDISAKSYLVVAGAMLVLWFTPSGEHVGEKRLGSPGSGQDFVIRFDAPVFHTLLPITSEVAFIETILGPHRTTTYASWAPEPGTEAAGAYYDRLCQHLT